MSIDIFFYKHKTAYEMRISDWISDVCSSDLLEKADPASQDLIEAIEYFDLLFPTLTERTATYRREQPESTVKAFHEWAASQIEPGRGDLLAIVQSVKDEVMNAQAFSVHDRLLEADRKSTRLNSSHYCATRIPSST